MSVCSPELAVLLRLEIKPRLANRLVSINSQEIRPGGAVELEISDSESKVFFGVLVLEIGGINLFLGKKFLEKF